MAIMFLAKYSVNNYFVSFPAKIGYFLGAHKLVLNLSFSAKPSVSEAFIP